MVAAAGQLPVPTPTSPPPIVEDPPDSVSEAVALIRGTLTDLWTGLIERVPLIALAAILLLAGLVVGRYGARWAGRGLQRTRMDRMVSGLLSRMVKALTVTAFLLLALSVVGINVGALLAVLGLAGVALALALQPLLENLIAGVLLLLRKPFVAGDQIIIEDAPGETVEATVHDIDFRVTRLVDYDGRHILVPNASVLSSTLVNLTARGQRRSRVSFSVDYRDDHNAVQDVVVPALAEVGGVLEEPRPQVLCTGLGDSGVEFTAMYWTLPDIATVIHVEDRVVRAIKDAVEEAGMTIPWPIRTVSFDARDAGPADGAPPGRDAATPGP